MAKRRKTHDAQDLTLRLDALLEEIKVKANSISPTDVAGGSNMSRSTLWGFINRGQNLSISVVKKLTGYLDGVTLPDPE